MGRMPVTLKAKQVCLFGLAHNSLWIESQLNSIIAKLRRILLAVRAEAAKRLIVIFLCHHETWKTTLLHLPAAQKSFFFSIKLSSMHEK